LIYGNPYCSLIEKFGGPEVECWQELLDAQIEDSQRAWKKIANSEFSFRDAAISGYGHPNHVISNGVDTDYFMPDPSMKKISVLWVGSRSRIKQLERALEITKGAGLNLLTVFKEDGMSRETMLDLYQSSLCLLVTSPVEGNSNAVLEAMACDLPVLTTRSGLFWGNEIGNAGEILPSNDDDAALLLKRMVGVKYDPRSYIFKNGLDQESYIKRMRETINV